MGIIKLLLVRYSRAVNGRCTRANAGLRNIASYKCPLFAAINIIGIYRFNRVRIPGLRLRRRVFIMLNIYVSMARCFDDFAVGDGVGATTKLRLRISTFFRSAS